MPPLSEAWGFGDFLSGLAARLFAPDASAQLSAPLWTLIVMIIFMAVTLPFSQLPPYPREWDGPEPWRKRDTPGPGLIKLNEEDEKAAADAFDLSTLRKDFYDDPFLIYHAVRDHHPLKVLKDGSIFASRFADVQTIYNTSKIFTSGKKIEFLPKFGCKTPLYEHHTTSLIFNDQPLHTRIRRILLGSLTTKTFEKMEPDIQRLVDGLLDAAASKGWIDLVEDFATVIPIEVIGNLLDIPHDERGSLREWSLAILGALEPVISQEQMDAGNCAVEEFTSYLRDLVQRRRENPGDPNVDVLTRLLQGEKDTGEALTESQLLQNCIFLLNAGNDTTINLIANGLVNLYQNPDQLELLLSDVDKYIDPAIDELLRFESPVQLGNRRTVAPVVLGGKLIDEGTRIQIGIGAANRDPAQFPNPDRLDILRSPNNHHAFAGGIHRCLGEKLARMEGRVAIGSFVKRFPNFRVEMGAVVRTQRARFRGYTTIPCNVRG